MRLRNVHEDELRVVGVAVANLIAAAMAYGAPMLFRRALGVGFVAFIAFTPVCLAAHFICYSNLRYFNRPVSDLLHFALLPSSLLPPSNPKPSTAVPPPCR